MACMGLMELGAGGGGAGGGDELVCTDHGVPKPGSEGEDEPTPALCSSCAGRPGKAAPRPPDSMLPPPLPPLPLMWWAMGESICARCAFTGAGDGDVAASAWASSTGERRRSGPGR